MGNKYTELQMFYKKLSPGLAALIGAGAGWALSDTFVEAPRGQMTVSQRREWDRVVDEAMRQKRDSRNRKTLRSLRKDFYSLLQKTDKGHAPVPPRQGLIWDAAKSRWTNPDNVGKTVVDVQGRKRIRGTGTGVHERTLATGKTGGRGSGGASAIAGRKFRSAEDTARSGGIARTTTASRSPTRGKSKARSSGVARTATASRAPTRGSALQRYKVS